MGRKKGGVLAIGLVALDVIEQSDLMATRYRLDLGGSCGNVVAILALCGVPTHICSRMADDYSGRWLKRRLKQHLVDTTSLATDIPATATVVQHSVAEPNRTHRFSFRHPATRQRLPFFQAPTKAQVRDAVDRHGPLLIYIDRLFPGALEGIRMATDSDIPVVVEPSHQVTKDEITRYLKDAFAVKVSEEHLAQHATTLDLLNNRLQIVTRGNKGLKYRIRSRSGNYSKWKHVAAVQPPNLGDTAGAGDWISGILIAYCWHTRIKQGGKIRTNDITKGLRVATKAAGLSVQYNGPRGVLYSAEGRKALRSLLRTGGIRMLSKRLRGGSLQTYTADRLPL